MGGGGGEGEIGETGWVRLRVSERRVELGDLRGRIAGGRLMLLEGRTPRGAPCNTAQRTRTREGPRTKRSEKDGRMP